MLSVRIPEDLEAKIELITKEKNITKSEVVKEAILQYIARNEKSSYELGKDLFGKYGSDDGDSSITYKTKIKERLREKNTR